jgi:sterol desaturase/sphingolipid hydroxylase (fatty acid hydroxylase superfamily)
MEVGLTLLLAGALMAFAERRRPGHELPAVEGWKGRALLLSGVQVGAAALGALLLGPWLRRYALLDAEGLGTLLGSVWGYAAITFVYYWWHRARHQVGLLWRTLHQVHHSPARLELLTTYYKHPLESISNVVFGALLMYVVLGLTPAQAALVTTACGLAEFFYHCNVRTPRWLRYLIQRPEAHRLHHELGVHAGNYADLPLWDLMFGTYRDPDAPVLEVRCGFLPSQERRLREMLRFREVTS